MAYLWTPKGKDGFLQGPFIQAHIPKTGGKWVRRALLASGYTISRDVSGGHAPAPKSKFPSFVFIRQPVTWLASWWAHCQRHGWAQEGPLPANFHEETPYHKMQWMTSQYRSDDFEEFVRDLLAENPGFVTEFFRPFIERADYVGRQETLRRDLESLVGPLAPIARFNVGDNKPHIPEALRMYVASREDLEWLGYA